MKENLIQKRIFSGREFTLTEKELHVKTWDLKDKREFTIKLENIGNQISYHSNPPIVKNVFAVLCAIVPLVLLAAYFLAEKPPEGNVVVINLILWIPIAAYFFLSRSKNDTYIIGGTLNVVLYQDIPTKKIVDDFAHRIISKATEIIYTKYTKIDPDLPEETQMNQLHWLLTSEVITDSEYEELKQEYKSKKLL